MELPKIIRLVKLERNADKSGRGFRARSFWRAWSPGKTRPQNSQKTSPSKFAEKFTGNFPKLCQAPKNHPKSALHNLGINLSGLKNANAKRRVFWTQRTWTQPLAPREAPKSQEIIAMRFLNASVLERKSLNRNLSWGFPLGNQLPKTRVLKHRVLERKRRPNANASVLGTQRFRTLRDQQFPAILGRMCINSCMLSSCKRWPALANTFSKETRSVLPFNFSTSTGSCKTIRMLAGNREATDWPNIED